jgi:hypothetical protein
MSGVTPSSSIVDLFTHDLHFEPSGIIRADERRMTDGNPAWRSAAIFQVETPEDVHADHWEKHPLGEEAVCCLRGAILLYLRGTQPDTPDDLIHLLPGQVSIVPRDRWHRLEADEPTDLLAVTVRHGTKLEKRTPSKDKTVSGTRTG